MAIENMIALDNIDSVVTDKNVPVDAHIDLVTAAAYIDSKKAEEHVNDVADDLKDKAKGVITEDPETPAVKAKNTYTTSSKLVLDESIDDFNLKSSARDDLEDEYLDYDMYDFVYGLVTDDWPRPKNPLGRPMRKFQHTDSDDYKKTNSPTGLSQVASDLDGNVVIYANDPTAFNDVKEACDYYHITYRDVVPKRSKESHWGFSLTIEVPMAANGYPVMVEDFFEQYGLKMSDVIEDHKVGKGKSANWGKTYETRVEKDRKGLSDIQNDSAIESTYAKYVKKASWSDEPLDVFIKEMFTDLDSQGVTYSKTKLKKRFIDEFNDSFEDE